MAGALNSYFGILPNDNDNSGCSLSINVKNNEPGSKLCQIFINDSKTLISSNNNPDVGKQSNNQLFIFGPSGSNQLALNTYNGTSTVSATSYNAYSDYRMKENIKDLDETYTINNIRPLEYTIIDSNDDKKHFGVLAHELAEIYPNLVDGEKDCSGKMQTVNYVGLIPILIKRIQILKKKIKELEERL